VASRCTARHVDRIKRELENGKQPLKRVRHRQWHKPEAARKRQKHLKHRRHGGRGANGLVASRHARGQLIGWLQSARLHCVNVRNAKGRLVAREINGMTLDLTGWLVGHSQLGLVVLGCCSIQLSYGDPGRRAHGFVCVAGSQ
jgi:hypothetical protein